MNWLLPAIVVFLALSAWQGYQKGFIKKMVGIVSLMLTLFVTSVTVPYMTDFLRNKTALYHVLTKGIAASKIDILETMEIIGLGDMVNSLAADLLLQAAAFIITLIFVSVLVQGVAFSFGIAARLPVLHGLNKMAGLIVGAAEGIIVVWIFFFAITACATTAMGGKLLLMVADSDLLSWIYRGNLLYVLLK